MKTDVEIVTQIVRERASDANFVVHLSDTPHEKHAASRQSCCWGSPFVVDNYEIAVCCPSRRRLGDSRTAFFTFKRIEPHSDEPEFGLRSRHCRFTRSAGGW